MHLKCVNTRAVKFNVLSQNDGRGDDDVCAGCCTNAARSELSSVTRKRNKTKQARTSKLGGFYSEKTDRTVNKCKVHSSFGEGKSCD